MPVMDEPLYFYTKTMPFLGLSNFSPPGVELNGIYWPTVEHFFQAQKFAEPDARERIRQAATPKEARSLGQSRAFELRSDWDEVREEMMLRGLRLKFRNPAARELLLSTGTRPSSGPPRAGRCRPVCLFLPYAASPFRPLMSHVSPLVPSMKKPVVHALASGGAASKRSEPLSLRRLHSSVSAARGDVLRNLQLSSTGALRAPASRTSSWVSPSERLGTDRQPPQGSEQYTSAQVQLACARSKWRSSRSLVPFAERANLSFKRTCLRQSA